LRCNDLLEHALLTAIDSAISHRLTLTLRAPRLDYPFHANRFPQRFYTIRSIKQDVMALRANGFILSMQSFFSKII
jgi:hypothetical protein